MAEASETPKVTAADLPAGSVPDQAYVDSVMSSELGDVTPTLATQKASTGPQRPEHIPEQFWDADKGIVKADDLAKSYAALRSKMDSGKGKEETPDPTAAVADAAKADGVKIERPDGKAAEPSPLTTTVNEVARAYAETGEVTEEQIKSIEGLGMPREMIDTYLAGVKALEANLVSEVHRVAGGEDKFSAAQTWAAEALSDADLAYYNANIDQPDKRVQTVEWLMAKHSAARPSEGALVGGLPAASSGDVFQTQEQVTKAMSDPRYEIDPNYRKEIAQKLARSRSSGSLAAQSEYFASR